MELVSDTTAIGETKAARRYIPRAAFDRRTRAAKRFAKLVDGFVAELGGATVVSEARMIIVRQLAGVVLQTEDYQAAIVRGEQVDAEQWVRLGNLQSRFMNRLGLGAPKGEPHKRTLADIMARHGEAVA